MEIFTGMGREDLREHPKSTLDHMDSPHLLPPKVVALVCVGFQHHGTGAT